MTSAPIPTTMKALVLVPKDRTATLQDVPVPVPGPNEILVKVKAIALNPIDSQLVQSPIAAQDDRIIGTDFAGVVVAVGSGLAESSDPRTKVGARVAGYLQGACSVNERPGAFGEYAAAEWDLAWLVPATLSFEQAAATTMASLTSAQGVLYRLGLPSPFHPNDGFASAPAGPVTVLIYGASSSVAMYAAQWVRLAERTSGRQVRLIGAASRSRHAVLRAEPYRYDVLVDYRDADWVAQVRAATDGRGVDYAVDCISETNTVPAVSSAVREGGQMAVFRSPKGGKYELEGLPVKPVYGAVWEGLGVEIEYLGFTVPANPAARKFATELFSYLGSGSEAKIQPNPIRLMPGGLEKVVPDGFYLLGGMLKSEEGAKKARTEDYMKPISAEKIVYLID